MTRSVFQRSARNATGDAIPLAEVDVIISGGVVADIFTDPNGGVAIVQPLIADANGYFRFYVEPGLYDVTATDPILFSTATFLREEIGTSRESLIDDDQHAKPYSPLNPQPIDISDDLINDLSQEFALDTYAELTSRAIIFPVGKKVRIKQRNDAVFIFALGGTVNDSYILDAGNGNTAVLSLDSTSDIVSFGAVSGLASGLDNSININFSINVISRLIMPIGDFEIHNPILIPITTYGYVWEGKGMEKSILRAVGMTGKNGIELADDRYGPRMQMRDFQVIGDCDNALNMDLASTGILSEIQMTEWRNLRLTSTGDAMKCNKHFSSAWYNVHTETTVSGHGFNIQGGNSTVLVNCYGHNIAGTGKAAYKILASATMIGCNGLDSGDYWGIFGGTVADDGVNAIYRINIIGGNSEDFNTSAILTRFTGSMTFDNWNSLAKATGVVDNYIQMDCSNSTLTRNGGSWVSKGATFNDSEQIVTPNAQRYIEINDESNNTPNYLRGGAAYRAATKYFGSTEFQVTATKMSFIDPDRNYGFNSEIPLVSVDAVVIDATGVTKVITENTVATIINSATGFVRGQSLYIMVNDANTTIGHLAAGSGRFRLTGGANIVASAGDVYEFVTFDNVEWRQVL